MLGVGSVPKMPRSLLLKTVGWAHETVIKMRFYWKRVHQSVTIGYAVTQNTVVTSPYTENDCLSLSKLGCSGGQCAFQTQFESIRAWNCWAYDSIEQRLIGTLWLVNFVFRPLQRRVAARRKYKWNSLWRCYYAALVICVKFTKHGSYALTRPFIHWKLKWSVPCRMGRQQQ